MNITINVEKLIKEATWAKLGLPRYGAHTFDIACFKPDERKKLSETLKSDGSPYAERLVKSIATFEASLVVREVNEVDVPIKARTIAQVINMMRTFFRALPSRRIYRREGADEFWQGYLVDAVDFHKAQRSEFIYTPAKFSLSLVHIGIAGVETSNTRQLGLEDVRGMRPSEVVARLGYSIETRELKAEMFATRARWLDVRTKVGAQFTATGLGNPNNVDGNEKAERASEDRNYHWDRKVFHTVQIDKDGPGQVVVDLTHERHATVETNIDLKNVNTSYFADVKVPAANELRVLDALKKKRGDDDEEVEEEEDEVESDDSSGDDDGGGVDAAPDLPKSIYGLQTIDAEFIDSIPVDPQVTVFDLRKHMRYRVDVRQLTEYRYDSSLRDKLVIDPASRMLIEMLLYQRAEFKDVISRKGGGATILCAGPPGVGKTLTAEVFSEVEKRPLYSVQCSQLGTTADELELELERCFARARRWGAILLLDEADVYIAQRGSNMEQNAIVGVFLRMLEYYNGVLFMTTNRADSVDDAILSRCVARIDYENPSPPDQVRIWNILAAQSGLKLAPGTAESIAQKYRLSGRDVKQLLKLAGLVAFGRKLENVDVATIEFCMRYKPAHKNEPPRAQVLGNR